MGMVSHFKSANKIIRSRCIKIALGIFISLLATFPTTAAAFLETDHRWRAERERKGEEKKADRALLTPAPRWTHGLISDLWVESGPLSVC